MEGAVAAGAVTRTGGWPGSGRGETQVSRGVSWAARDGLGQDTHYFGNRLGVKNKIKQFEFNSVLC